MAYIQKNNPFKMYSEGKQTRFEKLTGLTKGGLISGVSKLMGSGVSGIGEMAKKAIKKAKEATNESEEV
tara:strand:+ start:1460 stop:1666 length:207 start_codon:yes stop_codon:yes gene_type:complete